jgi:hypothetical protein
VIFSHVLYQLSYLGTVGRFRAWRSQNPTTHQTGHAIERLLRGPAVDDEEHFAGAHQTQLAAGDRFDRVRVLFEVEHLTPQKSVLGLEGGDRCGEFFLLVARAKHVEEAALAGYRVQSQRHGNKGEYLPYAARLTARLAIGRLCHRVSQE